MHTFSYIPRELEIEGRPELSVLPLNVMITRHAMRDGKPVMGVVTYEPDFSTLRRSDEDQTVSMTYYNCYSRDYSLAISFDFRNRTRSCWKHAKGKEVGLAEGGDDWKLFFIHVSFLGLEQGERCLLRPIPMPAGSNGHDCQE